MEIKIANKKYTLYFGWDFLDKVNEYFGIRLDVQGTEVNTKQGGMPFMEQGLESKDPITVQKVIQSATSTEKSKPSVKDIRSFIEDLLSDGKKYVEFVEELHEEIKKDKLLSAIQKMDQ